MKLCIILTKGKIYKWNIWAGHLPHLSAYRKSDQAIKTAFNNIYHYMIKITQKLASLMKIN